MPRSDLPKSDFPFMVRGLGWGLGEKDPAVPITSEAHRKVNRRVVVVYQRR